MISVTANVAPKLMHEMVRLALAGDREGATAVDARLAGLHTALFVEPSPMPVKWAVAEMGLCGKGIRLPLVWMTPGSEATVTAAMRQAGIH